LFTEIQHHFYIFFLHEVSTSSMEK
jgi:hypothetical protein